MLRSLFRTLKHIAFAVIAIIATVCVAEVGLRSHSIYEQFQNGSPKTCPLTPAPCPLTFHQLPPLTQVALPAADGGDPVIVRTNSLGLRGGEVTVPKRARTTRILCLGDDATLAANIAEEQTFSALVESALAENAERPIEVINAGIPGYCPLLSLAWARRQLPGLRPDLVVLCCDLSDVSDDRNVRPLARFSTEGTLLSVCHPATAQTPPTVLKVIEQEFYLPTLIRRHLGKHIDGSDADDSMLEGWPSADMDDSGDHEIHLRQAWEPIDSLRDLCEESDADFVVVLMPSSDTREDVSSATAEEIRRSLGKMAEEYGVPYLDVTSEFSAQAEPPHFQRDSGALTAAGHQAFAEILGWAIVHRNGGSRSSENEASTVTPAAAHERVTAEPAGPSPLPTPERRPRANAGLAE